MNGSVPANASAIRRTTTLHPALVRWWRMTKYSEPNAKLST